jgi:hypothetical protein
MKVLALGLSSAQAREGDMYICRLSSTCGIAVPSLRSRSTPHVEPRRLWRNPVLPFPSELSSMLLAAAEYEKHGREGGPADD